MPTEFSRAGAVCVVAGEGVGGEVTLQRLLGGSFEQKKTLMCSAKCLLFSIYIFGFSFRETARSIFSSGCIKGRTDISK